MVTIDNLTIPTTVDGKQQRYNLLLDHIKQTVERSDPLISNLGNIAALLHHGMGFSWTGFYTIEEDALLLGPFQGPAAIVRIPRGVGVCGMAFNKECTVIVDDVEQFAGHVPVTNEDKSEMVVPAFLDGEIHLLLNVNSKKIRNFTEIDKLNLERVMHWVEKTLIA